MLPDHTKAFLEDLEQDKIFKVASIPYYLLKVTHKYEILTEKLMIEFRPLSAKFGGHNFFAFQVLAEFSAGWQQCLAIFVYLILTYYM